eukprot:scaffold1.g5716.t1
MERACDVEPSTSAAAGPADCYLIQFNVSKKHNIGTLARCATAFGVRARDALPTPDLPDAPALVEDISTRAVWRSLTSSLSLSPSSSYVEFVHFATLEECCADLRGRRGCSIIGVEITADAAPVTAHPFRGPTALMLGNEGQGLNERQLKLCDSFVYIPQFGPGTASLNVACAASIVLHHFATWAGYSERPREGTKFVVAERPQRAHARGCVPPTPEEAAAERERRRAATAAAKADDGPPHEGLSSNAGGQSVAKFDPYSLPTMTSSNWADLLLLEEGEQATTGAKAKRKNKKSKAKAPAQPIQAAEAPAAPAEEEGDADFRPVSKKQPAKPAQQGLPARAADAAAQLEKAATARGDARSALVAQWSEQALSGGQLFQDAGGSKLTFVQVLAASKALDRLLDGYISSSSAVSEGEAGCLAALLSAAAHPSLPPRFGALLAATVTTLSSLLAADPLAPVGEARHSLAAAAALLRGGAARPPPAAAPAAKLAGLEAELGKAEAALARTTLAKEQNRLWAGVLDNLGAQVDLAGAGGADGLPPEVAAALRPLRELQAALKARLEGMTSAPAGRSVKEQVADAQAAFRREEAALAAQLAAVEERIAKLEAELAAAKAEAGALRARRAATAQHHQKAVEALRAGGAGAAASATALAGALRAGLDAAAALRGAVEAAGAAAEPSAAADGSDAGAVAARLAAGEVPAKLVGAVQQVVDLNLAHLRELGSKATFYRERLVQAARQAEQLAKLKLDDPNKGEESKRQRGSLERMLKDVVAGAEAAATAARAAVDAYQARLPALLRLPGFVVPAPEYVAGLEAKVAEAAQLACAVADPAAAENSAAAASAAAPAAPAAPRAAAAAQGPSLRPAAATGPAAEPIVPAPPPGAGRSAAPGSNRQQKAAPAPAMDMSSLEARLAALEEANRQKDVQIAAMLSSAAAMDVGAPLAAMGLPPLSSSLLASPLGLMPAGAAGATLVPAPQVPPAPMANGHHAPGEAKASSSSRSRRRA